MEISDEMTLAIFVGRFRGDAGAPFRPSSVRLTRPAPQAPTRHAALLGAPVTFGCSVSGMEIPLAAWTAPMRRADPALQETLRQLASRLELGASGDDLELALRARLRTLLPEGKADARSIARTLGLSERTLNRRLQETGKTYRGVLDAFREAEAERLLASGKRRALRRGLPAGLLRPDRLEPGLQAMEGDVADGVAAIAVGSGSRLAAAVSLPKVEVPAMAAAAITPDMTAPPMPSMSASAPAR